MTKKLALIGRCFVFFCFVFYCNNVVGLKLRNKNTQVESSKDRNDELAGSLFDDMTSPDEIQSESLNNEDNEIEGKESNNDDDLYNDNEKENDNVVDKEEDNEEVKRLAEEEEAKRLAEEEQAKRLAEEEEAKKLKEEEQAKKVKEEQEKRLKEEEEAKRLKEEQQENRLKEEEQAKRLAEEEAKKEDEEKKKKEEEEEKKKKEEEEKKKKEEEEKKKKEEEEKKLKEEEAKKKKEEEEKKKAEEEKKKEEEEAKKKEEEEEKKKKEEENKKKKQQQQSKTEPIPIKLGPIAKIHHPFQEEKSTKTRIWSLITLIIFGSCYLILRIIYNLAKNRNKFFAKGTASLSNQIMFLLICYIMILLFYIYGTFDSIPINWEYLLSGMSLFIIGWFLYGSLLLCISTFITSKWKRLDKESTSFNKIRHEYDRIQNKNYKDGRNYSSSETKTLIEQFEFLVLKRFFFIPLYPVFKPSSLLKEMQFSIYLEKCLLDKLRLFFKFSWTCWILTIITMMFWNVFIVTGSTLFVLLFSIFIPLLGLAILLGILIYHKYLYRKVVQNITENNMSNYQDIEYNSNSTLQSQGHPVYLWNLIQQEQEMKELNKKSLSLHEHVHQRPPSLYENLLLGGASAFAFMFNVIQTCSLLFIAWGIILFAKHYSYIITSYSKITVLLITIPLFFIYLALYIYITASVLKWNAIVSSIEMNRNEKNVKKMVHYHIKKAARISDEIYLIFKRIYYDMKVNKKQHSHMINDNSNNLIDDDFKLLHINNSESELKLGFPHLQEIIRMNMIRYTGKQKDNGMIIDIKEDLLPFIKSFGNSLNAKEIEFMLHMISNFDEFNGKISVNDLFDICGAILHFRTKRPMDIFTFVFDTFYKNDPQYYKDINMSFQKINLFIDNYKEYFNQEQITFIKDQCFYYNDSVPFDSLISSIISFRQYYPY